MKFLEVMDGESARHPSLLWNTYMAKVNLLDEFCFNACDPHRNNETIGPFSKIFKDNGSICFIPPARICFLIGKGLCNPTFAFLTCMNALKPTLSEERLPISVAIFVAFGVRTEWMLNIQTYEKRNRNQITIDCDQTAKNCPFPTHIQCISRFLAKTLREMQKTRSKTRSDVVSYWRNMAESVKSACTVALEWSRDVSVIFHPLPI
ncbi:hypothetical protein L596_001842 [Steinernema carpocapsae]|uniref:Uncharacterized protein n=1 Tax=Steinernema carpocapsae TaxID=34508 RepID=A0A4U8UPG2_STECR|nr:hypothetical protein L596_001842 [Steinernema carpocapsae]